MKHDQVEVWLFNISPMAIFVHSPTMEPRLTSSSAAVSQLVNDPSLFTSMTSSSAEFTVHKVMSGNAIKVFDFERSKKCQMEQRKLSRIGPYDPYAVRVSFGKGWGSNYSRQDATNCPCWLEILLVAPPPPPPTHSTRLQSCDSAYDDG